MNKKELTPTELKKVLEIYQDLELKHLPAESDVEHAFSASHEKRMREFIRRTKRPYYRFISTKLRTVATITAIVIIVLTTTIVAIEPVQRVVFEFFQNIFPTYSIFKMEGEESADAPTTIVDRYVPTYIPEGYVLSEEDVQVSKVTTIYARENPFDEIILYQVTKHDLNSYINTEDDLMSEIELENGMKGLYSTSQNANILILHNDDYAFEVISFGEPDELIKFTESLAPQK